MTGTEADGPARSTLAHRRGTPPVWLRYGLRPQPTPVPWAAVARASVALAAPLAVGFAADRPVYGALASMGALSGVIGDTADAYRMRILNIAVPQLFGALGIMIGTLVYGTGWAAVAVLTAIGLASGMMSTIGAVASVSGLLLLLNSVVGAGLPMPDPWWVAPLLLTLGGLFVLVLTLLAWPFRRKLPERVSVTGTYLAVADLLAAAGTDAYEEKRQAVTDSLNTSYDLILARRARYHGRSGAMVRLLSQLNVVIPLVEAAPRSTCGGSGSPTRSRRRCGTWPPTWRRPAPAATGPTCPPPTRPPPGRSTARCATRSRSSTRPNPIRTTSTTGWAAPPRSAYASAARPATSCSPAPPGGTDCASHSASDWPRR